MIRKEITIKVVAEDEGDFEYALEAATQQIREGYLSGQSGDPSERHYSFEVDDLEEG